MGFRNQQEKLEKCFATLCERANFLLSGKLSGAVQCAFISKWLTLESGINVCKGYIYKFLKKIGGFFLKNDPNSKILMLRFLGGEATFIQGATSIPDSRVAFFYIT